MRACVRRALAVVALLAAAASSAAAQDLTWTSSLGYAAGEYIFSETTRSFTFSNGLDVRFSRVRLSASLPLVYQNTTAIALVHGVPVPTGGPESDAVRRRQADSTIQMRRQGLGGNGQGGGSGSVVPWSPSNQTEAVDTIAGPGDYQLEVADPLFSTAIELLDGGGWIRSLQVAGFAKAPVASIESGVGTEAWDFGGGVSLAAGNARFLLFADATWWSYGDMPDLELEDGLSYGVGVGVSASEKLMMIASFSGMGRIVPTADPYASLAAAASYEVMEGKRISAGAGVGMTESASDLTLFLGWSAALSR